MMRMHSVGENSVTCFGDLESRAYEKWSQVLSRLMFEHAPSKIGTGVATGDFAPQTHAIVRTSYCTVQELQGVKTSKKRSASTHELHDQSGEVHEYLLLPACQPYMRPRSSLLHFARSWRQQPLKNPKPPADFGALRYFTPTMDNKAKLLPAKRVAARNQDVWYVRDSR
jgi:hypothetical protein